MEALLHDLSLSVMGFFAGVGVTVLWYRLRGKLVIVERRNERRP